MVEMTGGRLEGRTALVTGATQGIGFATAERLAAEGARVMLSDIRGHEDAASRLRDQGFNAAALTIDVCDDTSVEAGVAATVEEFGSIDVLVNNAALSAALRSQPFEEQSIEDWQRVYDVNVLGTFRMCRAVSPHMRRAKRGRIINLASGTAFKGVAGRLHYVASKGAIVAMTRALASELGTDGITVNAVSPGITMTESVAGADHLREQIEQVAIATRILKRSETARDVANAIYFLAGDDGGFLTGQTISVDGGSVLL